MVKFLRIDAGLQPLIPRLASCYYDGVQVNILKEESSFLAFYLFMLDALIANKNVDLSKSVSFADVIASC